MLTKKATRRKPFAVELFELWEGGVTVSELVARTGIPEERIRARLRAGGLYAQRLRAACAFHTGYIPGNG